MYRRRGGVEGIYRCEIPDTYGFIQTLHIGVYSANNGEWYVYTIKPRGLQDLDTRGNVYEHLHAKSSGVYGFLEDLNPVGPRVSSDMVFIL